MTIRIDPTTTPVTALDPVAVDHVLTTTRAVRRRLDLERPVDVQTILDCIDVAEQAPTGGNQSSRRWIVVRDPEVKAGLAGLYAEGAGRMLVRSADRLAGTDDPMAATMASAAHLVEHLAEVPVIVIPTILGLHDGSGRPGLFDSVIQSAWSFCLALRARGLGTAWVTAVLSDVGAVKELLGIPAEVTEIVMLPVAHTQGTDFSPVPRSPAREITYFDGWGRTFESGPTGLASFADGTGGVVEVDVAAQPEALWPIVTDIDFGGGRSEEFLGAAWAEGEEPGPGARFVGLNQHPRIGEWEVPCFVDVWDPPHRFGWVTSDPEDPGAQWRFELRALVGGATRLRHTVVLGPGPSGLTPALTSMPDKEERILRRRIGEHLPNMQRVVDAMKAAAEA